MDNIKWLCCVRSKSILAHAASLGRVRSFYYPGIVSIVLLVLSAGGCTAVKGNAGEIRAYPINETEAQWIREGNPIEFEGEFWYPVDGVENFIDPEMRLMGEYKGIQFFVDKVDVRPFDRIYTKFERNKFRFFERRPDE